MITIATPTYVTLLNNNQYNQTNTGSPYASSTSATDISPGGNTAGQAFQVQPDQLYPGMLLRFEAFGIYSTTSTPNLTLGIYYGGVAGTALCSTGTVAQATVTNAMWYLRAISRVITVGTSGSIATMGIATGVAGGSTINTPVLLPATSSSGNTIASLDTSTAKLITVGATWGTNSASNTITQYYWTVEALTEP